MGIFERTYIKSVDNDKYNIRKRNEIPMLKSAVSIPKTAENGNTRGHRRDEASVKKREDKFLQEYESIPEYNIVERAADKVGRAVSNVFNGGSGGRGTESLSDQYARKSEMTEKYNNIINKRAQQAMDEYQANGGTGLPVLAGVNASNMLNHNEYQKAQEEIAPYLREKGVTNDQLEDILRAQALQEQNKSMAEYAKEHPALATGASFITNQIGGLEGAVNAVNSYLSGTPMNANQAVNTYNELTPTIRGQVRNDILNKKYSDYSDINKIMANVGAGAYDVLTSLGDMGMSTALGGGNQGATLSLMSTIAGNSALQEQMDKDTTPAQKMATALASGTIEALTEKLPLENMFSFANTQAGRNTVKQIAKNILKQTATEASEEAISEVANAFVDELINGKQSNYEQAIQNYMASGMNQEQATAKALMDIAKNAGYSALIGGLSGAASGGASSILGNTAYDMRNQIPELNPVQLNEENATELPRMAENKISEDITNGAESSNTNNLSDEDMQVELDKHFEDVDLALQKLMNSRPSKFHEVSLGKFHNELPEYITKSTLTDIKRNYIDKFNENVRDYGDGFEFWAPDDVLLIQYKDGTQIATNSRDFDSKKPISTKNIDSIIVEGGWGTTFAGNNVQLYNDREETNYGQYGYTNLLSRYNDYDDIRADFITPTSQFKYNDTIRRINERKEQEKARKQQEKLMNQQPLPIEEELDEEINPIEQAEIENQQNQANQPIPELKPQDNANELEKSAEMAPNSELAEQKSGYQGEKLNFKLTGKPVSDQFMELLDRLNSKNELSKEDEKLYSEVPEVVEGMKNVATGNSVDDQSPRMQELRKKALDAMINYGSAVRKIGADGKPYTEYVGEVRQGARADIIYGLSGSGKSSTLVDPISFEHKSRLVDSDEAKKMFEEFYDDGWGSGYVHLDSKDIVSEVLNKSIRNHDNIVIPKVGDDFEAAKKLIEGLKQNGYTVYVHFNDLPPSKAAARNFRRYATDGRFVDLFKTSFKYGNKPAEAFERLIKEGVADGYSKVSNDVEFGKEPVFLGGTEDIPSYYRAFRRGGEEVRGEHGQDIRTAREGETRSSTAESSATSEVNPNPTITNLTEGYVDPLDENAPYEDGTRPNFVDGKAVSKVATNTLKNNAKYMQNETAQEYLKKGIERGDYNYKKISELDSIAHAKMIIDNFGDRFKDHVRRSKEISGVMVDACMLKAKEAWEQGDYDNWRFYTRKARQAGTPAAQAVQAFAKYRDDISSVVAKANKLIEKGLNDLYKQPKQSKKRETCGKLSKILYEMESDNLIELQEKRPEKTRDQIRQGVENVIKKRDYIKDFSDSDYEYLTDLITNNVGEGEIRARIEARLRDGSWDLLEGVRTEDVKNRDRNGKLAKALKNIGNDYSQVPQLKQKPTFEQLKNGIKAEFEQEAGSLFNDMTEEDYDYLANLVAEGATPEDLQFKLEQKLATGNWDIDMDDIKAANALFEQARQYDNESKDGADLELKAYAILAKYLPNTSFKEKFDAWRYLAMLGNPRTHIRNMFGNFMFGQVLENTSDKIAATIEAGGQKLFKIPALQERTKSFKIVPAEMKKAARQYAVNHKWKSLTSGGQKYTDLQRSIKNEQKVFGDKNILQKGLQKASDAVSGALTWEDNIALQQKFGQAMAGYLYANGKDVSVFNSTDAKDQALIERAADYAVRRAKEATFHEDSAFANGWAKARNYINNSDSAALKGLGVMMDATMPFVKTPANILKQSLKYTTPIDFINDLRKSANPVKTIEDLSKFATGSMIMILGAALKSKGMLRTRGEEDEKQLDKLTGQQDYSLNVNGKSYTLDWLAPAAVPLFMGAEVYRNFVENKDIDPVRVASAIADPITEMSMLQGLNDAFDSIAGYAKNEDMSTLGNLAMDLAGGYASQAIPTVLGQVARSVDDTRRNTYYTGETTGTKSKVEKFGKGIANRIPGLSQMLEPSIDAWGEEQKNSGNSVGSRMFWNMLSPGFYSDVSKTPLEDELYNLNRQTDEASKALPALAKNAPYDKQGKLSEKDYTEWAKIHGQNERRMESELIENPRYEELSPTERASVMSDVKSFANALSKEEFKDKASKEYTYEIEDGSYKKKYEAYEYKGTDGLFDYITIRNEVKKLSDAEGRGESKADRINALNSMDDISQEDKIEYLKIMDNYTKRGQYIDQFISPKYAYDWYDVEANAGSKKSEKIYYIMKMDISDLEKKVLIGTLDMKDSDITYHLYTGK